jgi:hypothetical protein
VATIPTSRKCKAVPAARKTRAREQALEPHELQAKIVKLTPRRLLERVNRATGGGCIKCGSHFIEVEPAFVHCRYCGNMSRIRGASLLAQEEWELRSGMRLAS